MIIRFISGLFAPDTILSGGGGAAPAPASDPASAVTDPMVAADPNAAGWLSSLQDEALRSNQSLAPFKSVDDLAKSYIETKGLVGKKFAPPGADATPEQLADWRKALRVPESPEGYGEMRPEKLPAELWDVKAEEKFRQIFHQHHAPPALVKATMDLYGDMVEASLKEQEQMELQTVHTGIASLKKEWGGDAEFDRRINVVNTYLTNAAKGLGGEFASKPDSILAHPAFQDPVLVRLIDAIAQKAGGAPLVTGAPADAPSLQKQADDIMNPNSTSEDARAYRGEFGIGGARQLAAAEKLTQLLKSVK